MLKRDFNTSNYELETPLTKRKKKNVIALIKDELGRKIIAEFSALKPKRYNYLSDDMYQNKKEKAQNSAIRQKFKFVDYKHCLEANQLQKEINQLEKKVWCR